MWDIQESSLILAGERITHTCAKMVQVRFEFGTRHAVMFGDSLYLNMEVVKAMILQMLVIVFDFGGRARKQAINMDLTLVVRSV